MRLLQRIPLHGKANLAGSLEVFNLFNRKNYGVYDLTETSRHVPAAAAEHEPVVRPAHGAARVPSDLLTENNARLPTPNSQGDRPWGLGFFLGFGSWMFDMPPPHS